MASSPRRQRRQLFWQRFRHWVNGPMEVPVGWICLTGLFYMATGTIMGSFPIPTWAWYMALGGIIAQALALAGPRALQRFRWWSANGLALLAITGTGAIVIALSIALGYSGTDNIDEVVPQATAVELIRVSLIALVIAALDAIIGAETGDRLLPHFKRLPTTLILAATCGLGLGLGGLIGLLIRS